MNKKKYFFSLDLFRGFCGYGVAITHFFAFTYDNTYMEYLSLVFPEFFFVLSGFVLYPQLLKVLGKKDNLLIFSLYPLDIFYVTARSHHTRRKR